jgi:hypothetical protein
MFDFGDEWRVRLTLRRREDPDDGSHPRVLDRRGTAAVSGARRRVTAVAVSRCGHPLLVRRMLSAFAGVGTPGDVPADT